MKTLSGFSLIEVLVTMVILAFGLLGLAGLQAKSATMEMESYQRSQALILLNDMASRMETHANTDVASYVTGNTPLGTGDTQPTSCLDTATVPIGVARDKCEWSNSLKGAAESSGSNKVGAMIGARGCVTQIQAVNSTAGVCQSGIYEVTVAWQGMVETVAPSNTCASGSYSSEAARRVVSMRISSGTLSCVL